MIPLGGYAVSITQTKDSGYAIGCQPNGLFAKLSSRGAIDWTKDFGLKSCHVIQDSDGNYVLAGYKESNNNGEDGVLLKTDANGNLLWNETFSEVSVQFIEINAVLQTNNGDYLIAGSWDSTSWLAELDSNGNLLLNKTYQLSNIDNSFTSIAKTNDGGYILGGFDQNGAWLAKLDSQAILEWARPYQAEGDATSVAQTPDGGYVAAGDARIIKTDASGNLQWNSTGVIAGVPWAVTVTNDGECAVTGFTSNTENFTQEIWLAKLALEPASASPSTPEFPTSMIIAVVAVSVVAIAGITVVLLRKKTKGTFEKEQQTSKQ